MSAELVAQWDFEKRTAYIFQDGVAIQSAGELLQHTPPKGGGSPVSAKFVVNGDVVECKVKGVWWDIIKGGSATSTQCSAPVSRTFGEKKKMQDFNVLCACVGNMSCSCPHDSTGTSQQTT